MPIEIEQRFFEINYYNYEDLKGELNMKITEIGQVRSEFKEPTSPTKMRNSKSVIEIKTEFIDGLKKIEDYKYLQVIFYFHKSTGYELVKKWHIGPKRGLFSSRSPRRPSPLGVTTVKLLKREGNKLYVAGLDAIDGTPVVDIKAYSELLDQPLRLEKDQARTRLNELIINNNQEGLLLKAAEFHGYYCPYLALGVLAAANAVKLMLEKPIDQEKVLAIVETKNCFSDGIQYVSGATFGNNKLIYKDKDQITVTFASQENSNLNRRYHLKKNIVKNSYPEAAQLFTKVIAQKKAAQVEVDQLRKKWQKIAFEIINQPAENYFEIKDQVEIKLPTIESVSIDEQTKSFNSCYLNYKD